MFSATKRSYMFCKSCWRHCVKYASTSSIASNRGCRYSIFGNFVAKYLHFSSWHNAARLLILSLSRMLSATGSCWIYPPLTVNFGLIMRMKNEAILELRKAMWHSGFPAMTLIPGPEAMNTWFSNLQRTVSPIVPVSVNTKAVLAICDGFLSTPPLFFFMASPFSPHFTLYTLSPCHLLKPPPLTCQLPFW